MAKKKYRSNPGQHKGKLSSVVLVTNRKYSNKMRPIEFVCPVVNVPNENKYELTFLSTIVELEVGHSSHMGVCLGHLKY